MLIHTFLFYFIALLSMTLASTAQARVMNGSAIVHQVGSLNMCAVTFDDGPSQYTAQLLDSLQQEGIPATFFVLGKQVERHPELITRMVQEGHEVGSHSYSHPNFRKLGPVAQMEELGKTTALLAELGAKPRSFRPPYGKYSDMTIALAEEMGMSIVLWSSDSQDWKRRPVDYSQMRTTTGRPSLPGQMQGVFLFHDIRKGTVDDIHHIIATLRANGCQRFVTVQEYMNADQSDELLYTGVPPVRTPSAGVPPVGVQAQGPQGALNSSLPRAETTSEEDELLAQVPVVDTTAGNAPLGSSSQINPSVMPITGHNPAPSASTATASAIPAPPKTLHEPPQNTQQPKTSVESSTPWPWSLFKNNGT